jgi:hypothetical protein
VQPCIDASGAERRHEIVQRHRQPLVVQPRRRDRDDQAPEVANSLPQVVGSLVEPRRDGRQAGAGRLVG